LGVLAEKRPFAQKKITFYFSILRFLKIFRVASHCKAVTTIGLHFSKKIIRKKPTVGFLVFGASGKMIIVKIEKHAGGVEGESAANSRLDRAPHRPVRAIRSSLQKLDHGWHGWHGLSVAPARLISVVPSRTLSGQAIRRRPNTFLKLRALRALRAESKLRSRKSLIFRIGLSQLVDFHAIFRYFQLVVDISHAFFRRAWPRVPSGPSLISAGLPAEAMEQDRPRKSH
jgi:hypothetical protein